MALQFQALFERLPAELRNEIQELTMKTLDDTAAQDLEQLPTDPQSESRAMVQVNADFELSSYLHINATLRRKFLSRYLRRHTFLCHDEDMLVHWLETFVFCGTSADVPWREVAGAPFKVSHKTEEGNFLAVIFPHATVAYIYFKSPRGLRRFGLATRHFVFTNTEIELTTLPQIASLPEVC